MDENLVTMLMDISKTVSATGAKVDGIAEDVKALKGVDESTNKRVTALELQAAREKGAKRVILTVGTSGGALLGWLVEAWLKAKGG